MFSKAKVWLGKAHCTPDIPAPPHCQMSHPANAKKKKFEKQLVLGRRGKGGKGKREGKRKFVGKAWRWW